MAAGFKCLPSCGTFDWSELYSKKLFSLSLSLSLSLTHTLTYTLTHAIELLRQKQWKKEFHYLLSRQMNSNKRKSNDLISIPEKNPR